MRFVPERPPAADPFQVIARETQLLEEIERLFKPGVEQETAPRRQFAHEKLEYRGLRVSMIQVGLHHVELVEIGEQRAFAGIHSEPLDEWAELYSHVSACSPHERSKMRERSIHHAQPRISPVFAKASTGQFEQGRRSPGEGGCAHPGYT